MMAEIVLMKVSVVNKLIMLISFYVKHFYEILAFKKIFQIIQDCEAIKLCLH